MKKIAVHRETERPYGESQRSGEDRRSLGWRTFAYAALEGRRRAPRRADEKAAPYYTDYYDSGLLTVFFSILLLCVADAGLTLQILARGGTELNPLMDRLLEINPQAFFVGKYLITAAGLLFALLHINFKVLRLFPMRQVLCGLFAFYLFLVGYELLLLVSM